MKKTIDTEQIHSKSFLAGIIGLLIVALALFSEGYVRGTLVVTDNSVQTAQNIAASIQLFRWGMFAEIALLWFDLIYAFLIYQIFRHAGQNLAFLAFIFRIVPIAILGVVALMTWVSLFPVLDTHRPGFLLEEERAHLVLFGASLHSMGYHIALTFSFFHLGLNGFLAIKSPIAPSLIGYMLLGAAFCYMFSSVSSIVGAELIGIPTALMLLPCLIAELSLTVWLLVCGVRKL